MPYYGDKFQEFQETITRLRAPDGGCPWDKQQTHQSLRPFLLQECYEVLEAIDDNDYKELSAELGDLMLQIMLHSQIASEKGDFDIGDVIMSINDKIVYRHPHVFGDRVVSNAAEVAHDWEALKQKEGKKSLLGGIPRNMPSLAESWEIQQRAAQVGFDWDKPEDILDKLVEEVKELKSAESADKKEEEWGDLLFTLVNIARREGMDPESALRKSNGKFRRRFAWMEEACRRKGLKFSQLSSLEQNELWNQAKKVESR